MTTLRWPQKQAAERHVLLFQGHSFALHQTRTLRCPPAAAAAHVFSFHGQLFALHHCSTCRWYTRYGIILPFLYPLILLGTAIGRQVASLYTIHVHYLRVGCCESFPCLPDKPGTIPTYVLIVTSTAVESLAVGRGESLQRLCNSGILSTFTYLEVASCSCSDTCLFIPRTAARETPLQYAKVSTCDRVQDQCTRGSGNTSFTNSHF